MDRGKIRLDGYKVDVSKIILGVAGYGGTGNQRKGKRLENHYLRRVIDKPN
jgi:hypothetical protein